MTQGDAKLGEHERYRELAAAATAGALSANESQILETHLHDCEQCRAAFREYQILANEGITMLAASYEHHEELSGWNEGVARRRLLVDAEAIGKPRFLDHVQGVWRTSLRRYGWAAALAAGLLIGVGIGTWRVASIRGAGTTSTGSMAGRQAELLTSRKSVESALAAESDRLTRLQQEDSAKRRAFEELRGRFHALQKQLQQERASAQTGVEALSQARARAETQLNQVTGQRDKLSEQLRTVLQAYDRAQAELVSLRAERDKSRLQLTALEARINELTAFNQEQDSRLKDNERFLASDRDIRDLMSARNLYIADVFDVDSRSRTRNPFGRVFFTRGKSLLFYAFDLDQQPQLKNASTYQVWGQKETDQSESARPVDLGILYLDSAANRRWFLRFDNPQTLSEIDAVFVTVEPHGGSPKPTGKPFLFATLRKEANHP